MTSQFNINVSGGTAAFGAASQGDKNTVNAEVAISAAVESGLEAARSRISDLAERQQRSTEELKEVLSQLHALMEQATEKTPDTEKGSGILKTIRDNYSWAYPLVKDFVTVAWPALIAVI